MTPNITTWERAASVALGTAVVATAAVHERRMKPAAAVGLALVARGVTGYCPATAATRRARSSRIARRRTRRITLREAMTIRRPVGDIFEFWRHPRNLPRVMRHLERVDEVGQGRSHWVLRGPAGLRFEWDAETIQQIDNRVIAWRSLPGADVTSAGAVHFRSHGDHATSLVVFLEYDPPGGRFANALARAFGQSPASELREDLRALKQTLEAGEVPTVTGQPAGRRSATYQVARLVEA